MKDETETTEQLIQEKAGTTSVLDELTALFNRQGFYTLSQWQLKLAKRRRKSMVAFLIDLDHTKWINDTLGRQEGDNALIAVATILRSAFRETDIIGRLEEDKFAVLAIDASGKSVEPLIERLESLLAVYNGTDIRKYKLSLSMGIALYDPKKPASLDELMTKAHTLMNEARKKKMHRS